jgi:hypothetical protein
LLFQASTMAFACRSVNGVLLLPKKSRAAQLNTVGSVATWRVRRSASGSGPHRMGVKHDPVFSPFQVRSPNAWTHALNRVDLLVS